MVYSFLEPASHDKRIPISHVSMQHGGREEKVLFLGAGESTHLSAGLTYFLENNLRVSSLRPSCDVFWSY